MSPTAKFLALAYALVGCGAAATCPGCSSTNPTHNSSNGDASPTGGGSDGGSGVNPVDAGPAPNAIDPVEPVWPHNHAAARVKSPGQQMHFTAGLPFRILADAFDPNDYQ